MNWKLQSFSLSVWEGDVAENLPTLHVDVFHPMIYVKTIAQGLAQSEFSLFVIPSVSNTYCCITHYAKMK